MNILVVHCRYRISGGEDRVVAGDIRLLREMGHRVIPYMMSNSILDGMGTAARIKSVAGYLYPSRQRRELMRIAEQNSADVIWVHNTLWIGGTAPYEAGRLCNIPVIQTVHNFRFLCPNGICYRKGRICRDCMGSFPCGLHNSVLHGCYRHSRLLSAVIALNIKKLRRELTQNVKLVCVSEHQRRMLLEHIRGLNPRMVYIKRNGYGKEGPSSPYGERKNRFIYAGRLTESKGIRELLEAWKEICGKMGETAPELLICGAGELSEYTEGYIRDNGLDKVRYAGELPGREILELMGDSKALIYPTRWYEGEPVAITEAYSCKTPVIGTDIGGVSEMISDGLTGRLLSYDDMISDIVDAVTGWEDGFSYEADGISGFSERFSKESSIKAIKAIFEQ